MTPVREHYRHKPYEKVKAAKTEQLLAEIREERSRREEACLSRMVLGLNAAVESELSKILPDLGREQIARIEESW